MIGENEETSKISEFYSGTSIFITGATGFLGKLLLEKLLRACSDVKCVYLLLRSKRGKSIEKRFQELWNNVIFEDMKDNLKIEQKIVLVNGNCELPNLGLNEEDVNMLINNVDCVFHCAATVRFDEHIRTAAYTNVRSTQDLISLAKKMKNLKTFVHVSTAYSNCVTPEIKEQFYSSRFTANELLSIVEKNSEEALNSNTLEIIGKWPNTYTITKAIAEDIVREECIGLPMTIVRPSVILGCYKEPLTGWVDGIQGISGILAGVAVGLVRVIPGNLKCVYDLIPADLVVNCIIAAGWKIGTDSLNRSKNDNKITIYNCVSSAQNPILGYDVIKYFSAARKNAATLSSIWYPFAIPCCNKFAYLIWTFLLHTIPACFMDAFFYVRSKPAKMRQAYKKVHKMIDALSYFMENEWKFEDTNTQILWNSLNKIDQQNFNFNVKSIHWASYTQMAAIGIGLYILKDTYETMAKALRRQQVLKIIHYFFVILLTLGIYKILEVLLWNLVLS